MLNTLKYSCMALYVNGLAMQRCTKMLSSSVRSNVDPNIIVHVENVASLFSSPSTSSQKVRKRGSHKFLSQAIVWPVGASPELPKFAEMLLENDVTFITP